MYLPIPQFVSSGAKHRHYFELFLNCLVACTMAPEQLMLVMIIERRERERERESEEI